MKSKDGKNVDFQAFIDHIVEDQEFYDYTDDKKLKEVECHLNVDLILHESVNKFHAHKKLRSLKENKGNYFVDERKFSHPHAHSTHIIHPKREKLIMNIHEQISKKEKSLASLIYSFFL